MHDYDVIPLKEATQVTSFRFFPLLPPPKSVDCAVLLRPQNCTQSVCMSIYGAPAGPGAGDRGPLGTSSLPPSSRGRTHMGISKNASAGATRMSGMLQPALGVQSRSWEPPGCRQKQTYASPQQGDMKFPFRWHKVSVCWGTCWLQWQMFETLR